MLLLLYYLTLLRYAVCCYIDINVGIDNGGGDDDDGDDEDDDDDDNIIFVHHLSLAVPQRSSPEVAGARGNAGCRGATPPHRSTGAGEEVRPLDATALK